MTFETRLRKELHDYAERLTFDETSAKVVIERDHRRRRTRAFTMGGTIFASVVAVLLIVVLSLPAGDIEITAADDSDSGASAEVDALYMLESPDGETDGRILRVAPSDGKVTTVFSPEGEIVIDMTLSVDAGLIAAVTGIPGEGSILYLLDTSSGHEVWREPLPGRNLLVTTMPTKPASLTFAVDARRVYLIVTDFTPERPYDVALLTFDIESGRFLENEVALPDCGVAYPFTVETDRILMVCMNAGDFRWIERTDAEWEVTITQVSDLIGDLGAGSFAVDFDRRRMYLVGTRGGVTVVDLDTRQLSRVASLDLPSGTYVPTDTVGITLDGYLLYFGLGPVSDRTEQTGKMLATGMGVVDTSSWSTIAVIETTPEFTSLVATSRTTALLMDEGYWTDSRSLHHLDWTTGVATKIEDEPSDPTHSPGFNR